MGEHIGELGRLTLPGSFEAEVLLMGSDEPSAAAKVGWHGVWSQDSDDVLAEATLRSRVHAQGEE